MLDARIQPGAQVQARARRMGIAIWARIARIYGHNTRISTARLRAHDLSVAQFDALAQIGAHEGLTQQELAQRLLVTEGNITQLLDRLEERGLISRCREGRIKRLVLTEAGKRVRNVAVPDLEAFQAEQFAALTPNEQRTLLTLLGKLQRASRAC
ncbi:MAG TPA: MarR family transcriptional regulator [Ktedonobacterales bacterium]